MHEPTGISRPQAGAQTMKLERSVTLLGGIALVIGGVIGMGIYALIAGIGAQAGGSLWLAFTIAVVISIIGVAPMIQLASALPRAGGGYLYTSRLLSPLFGCIASYWAILGGACTTAFVSLGVAGYLGQYLPWDLPIQLIAVLLIVLFYILYLFGLKLATSLQILMVAQLFIALLLYAVIGSFQGGLKFSLDMPQGMGGFIMAIVLAYSACIGFQVIAEMGEEMVHARRNIPLSIVVGGAVIVLLYIFTAVTFINSIPYDFDRISNMSAPLTETAAGFLPPFLLGFLSLGAVSAGLTSFNAAATAIPREFFSQARDGIVPTSLAKVDQRTRTPLNAVTTYFILVLLLVLLGQSIDFYGYMAAVGILMLTALMSTAAVRLPKKYPEHYQRAYFRISRYALVLLMVLSVITSLGFVFIVFLEMSVVGLSYLAWTGLVMIYFFLRVRFLKKRGFDPDSKFTLIPGSDEENTD